MTWRIPLHSRTARRQRPRRPDRSRRRPVRKRCGAILGPAAPAGGPRGSLRLALGRGRVVERLGQRVARRIDADEQFDPPLGLFQQPVALPEQLDRLFVAAKRLGQPGLAFFQFVNDRLDPRERGLEAKGCSEQVSSLKRS